MMKPLALTCTAQSSLDVSNFSARVRRAAVSQGLDARRSDELSRVVAALGTNAVVHGRGGAITVVVNTRSWLVSTVDVGPGFERLDVEGDAGGLGEVRRLSSTLSLQNCSVGAHVVAARQLAPMN